MKATTILFAGCMILFTQTVQAQDVFGRYLMDKNGHIYDAKLSYAFNAIPVFTGNNIGYQFTYITNYKLFGDGVQDPIIGFSTSLSSSYASYMSDKSQVRYGLMQDGLLNFVPSLYISVLPEAGSRFRLFANAAGGIKGFAKLASVDPTTEGYVASDNYFGINEQWVFDLGAGIDYDRRFSFYFKYGKAWNDFSATTRDYYKKYINPNTTFLSYLNVKADFRLCDKATMFVEWSGYNHSFENESMARFGIAYRFPGNHNETKKNDDELKNEEIKNSDLNNRVGDLEKQSHMHIVDTKPKEIEEEIPLQDSLKKLIQIAKNAKTDDKSISDLNGLNESLIKLSHTLQLNAWKENYAKQSEAIIGQLKKGYNDKLKDLLFQSPKLYWPIQKGFIARISDAKTALNSVTYLSDFEKWQKKYDLEITTVWPKELNDQLDKQRISVVAFNTSWDSAGVAVSSISGIDFTNMLYYISDTNPSVFFSSFSIDNKKLTIKVEKPSLVKGLVTTARPEAIRVISESELWISNEEGTDSVTSTITQYKLNAASKNWTSKTLALPSLFSTANYSKNAGIEALALSKGKDSIWFVNEKPFKKQKTVRLVKMKIVGAPKDTLSTNYELDDKKGVGITELLVNENDKKLVVLERAYDETTCIRSFKIYQISTSNKKDVKLTDKELLFDSENLNPKLLDNYEGMTWGPKSEKGFPTLILISDNNEKGGNTCNTNKQKTILLALEIKPKK